MIQRIQSLHLLLVAILMAILCFVPYAEFLREGELCELYAWGIKTTGENPVMVVPTPYMGILVALSALLPLVAIFLFRKRLLQIRLCVVQMILLAGVQIYIGIYLYRAWSAVADKLVFSIVDIFPLIAIIFTWLAYRGIIRDEALVKSLDRIR